MSAPALAREIDLAVRRIDVRTQFYPERLDVSFDFAPHECERRLCDICIFGKNEAKKFCSATNPTVLCPVPFITTGYKKACIPLGCPVLTDEGVSLCRGIS